MELEEAASADASTHLLPSLDLEAPSAQRAVAVLQGQSAGVVWSGGARESGMGIIRELSFGLTFFPGFDADDHFLDALAWAREASTSQALTNQSPPELSGHTHVELWDHDPRIEFMPEPTELGRTAVFFGGRRTVPVPTLPSEGPKLVDADRTLFRRAQWRQDQLDIFGSEAAFFRHGFARYLVRGSDILCEAYAEFRSDKRWEVGVVTAEDERGRGFAFMTCADLLSRIEGLGYEAVWHAAASNEPSLALARKLGFRRERYGPMYCYEAPAAA